MNGKEQTHPSDLALDRGGPVFEAHVASCDLCRARVHAAAQIRARFDDVVFPATVAAVRAAAARTQPRRRPALWFFVGGPAALAIAGIVLLLMPAPAGVEGGGQGSTGIKGPPAPALEIVVKRGGDVFRLSGGGTLRPGDGLRFVYRGATPRHAALWTRDRRGHLVRFFPAGATSALIRPGETLPAAVVVDAVPGAEHVELWMSPESFDVTEAGSPPAGVTVLPLDIGKEP